MMNDTEKRLAGNASPATSITHLDHLIDAARQGDGAAIDELFAVMYRDLHQLAHARLRRGASITLLDTTSLVHESYLRLHKAGQLAVTSRGHFLAYAAQIMRSIVVDFARARSADRRGGQQTHVALDTDIAAAAPEEEIIRVHEALEELAKAGERLVRIVEMRYFAGLTEEEIAEALGISARTVRRDWDKARLLLRLALQ